MFVRDERAKHHKSGETARLRRNLMNAFQATGKQFAPMRSRSKPGDGFGERCCVNASREIAGLVEVR
jgi:hypothetical protein